MTDIKTKEARSRNMAAIKGKNTKPEQYVCHELFRRGYRYRKNTNNIYGHPDIFLRKYNTAIFVHGCFWHRHDNCKYAYIPKTRTEYWLKKFEANQKRDRQVQSTLTSEGIKCLVIWECTVRKMTKDTEKNEAVMKEVISFIRSTELFLEL